MYDFNQAPATPQSPIPPALADLLEVASMETPDGKQPTVAAQYANKALQAMAPQMPQGMPPEGMPSQGMASPTMSPVQEVAEDAALGGQIQQQQQQEQQQQMMQALQQMLQQQGAQQNAMRFGVAAAPGAQSVGMAEGGIAGGVVGYAGGNPGPHPLNDPETLRAIKEQLERKRRAEALQAAFGGTAPEAAAASTAAEARGVSSLLRSAGRIGGRALGPLGALGSILALGIPTRGGDAILRGGEGDEAPPYSNEGRNAMIDRALAQEQENAGVEGRNYPAGSGMRSGIAEAAAAGAAEPPAPERRPAPGGVGIGQLAAPQAPAGPSMGDMYRGRAMQEAQGYETEGIKPADIVRATRERTAALEPLLREMGVDPEQYKKDIAKSEEREARRLRGLEALEAQSKEARSGINRMIEFFSAGANRVFPGALGQQHANLLRRDLAENERFFSAREQVMGAEERERAAIRDKQRAEVMGNIKAVEAAEARAQDARNKKRDGLMTMYTEFAKSDDKAVKDALDRQLNVDIENMRNRVKAMELSTAKEGNLELKRANLLRNIDADAAKVSNNIERNFRAAMRDLGILDPTKPTPDQQRKINELEAARDASLAKLELTTSQLRAQAMGGTAGVGKVERLPSSK